MTKSDEFAAYRTFTRGEWAALRSNTPLTLIGHNVVGRVRIHWRRNFVLASFESSQKPHHAAQIIALRKSFAPHQLSFLQDPSGV
jgi:hypothetical protein